MKFVASVQTLTGGSSATLTLFIALDLSCFFNSVAVLHVMSSRPSNRSRRLALFNIEIWILLWKYYFLDETRTKPKGAVHWLRPAGSCDHKSPRASDSKRVHYILRRGSRSTSRVAWSLTRRLLLRFLLAARSCPSVMSFRSVADCRLDLICFLPINQYQNQESTNRCVKPPAPGGRGSNRSER